MSGPALIIEVSWSTTVPRDGNGTALHRRISPSHPGEVVALVGESGSGKTTLGMPPRLLASNGTPASPGSNSVGVGFTGSTLSEGDRRGAHPSPWCHKIPRCP